MFDKANEPAASGDGRPKPEDLVTHLLIVRVLEHRPDNPMGVTRTTGKNPDGTDITVPADCIMADVVDLDGEGQPAFYDYVFLQAKLIAHFKTNVGKVLIGTLGKYPDQGQRKGAYFFQDESAKPRMVAVGEAWAANNPDFFGSQAPGATTRQTRNSIPAQNHGQHEPVQPGQMENVHAARSTLEAMRAANGTPGFEERIPF